ncbi:MAG: hypothetical protein M3R21_10245 [Candidatus Dormibacteraeota bacterium]|nr:hypothetical protein [Candidatus Dormibacteraeota bacterium]
MGTLKEAIDDPAIQEMGPKARIAAVLAVAAVAAGIGLVIYRRRRRRSLMQRLRDALPEVDDIRASLKRPLARAAKAL